MAGVTQDLLPHNGDKVKAILTGLLDMVHDLARTSAVRSDTLSAIEHRVQWIHAKIQEL